MQNYTKHTKGIVFAPLPPGSSARVTHKHIYAMPLAKMIETRKMVRTPSYMQPKKCLLDQESA